jgi:polysaccharide export outer membrane protein
VKNKSSLSILFLVFLCCQGVGVLRAAEEADAPFAGPEFLLGPADVLEISVWKDENLTKQVVVRPDGKVSFPLIGDIVAQGRTVEELRQAVAEKIKNYVPDAPVTVILLQLGSTKVYVVGKVHKSGMYPMGNKLTVLQLLAMAGGMTTFADEDDILILRTENGEQKTIQFDYKEVSSGKNLDQNVVLKPGDTIVVP